MSLLRLSTHTHTTQITPEAKDLIKKMLHMDPTARVTASQALAHDWVRKDGVAPDVPLDVNVVQSLKDFTGYSKLKQLALRHVAMTYSDEEIRDIRDQFSLMDKDGTGTLSLDEMIQALQNMQLGENQVRPLFMVAVVGYCLLDFFCSFCFHHREEEDSETHSVLV